MDDRPPPRTTPPTDFDKAMAAWVARNKKPRTRIVVAVHEVEAV